MVIHWAPSLWHAARNRRDKVSPRGTGAHQAMEMHHCEGVRSRLGGVRVALGAKRQGEAAAGGANRTVGWGRPKNQAD